VNTFKNIINIQINKNTSFPFNKKWVENIIKSALKKENITRSVEIDCLITDDSFIRVLNKNHRGIDEPTDVLSFAFHDRISAQEMDFPQTPDSATSLGSIVVSYERAAYQASKQAHSVGEEMMLLLTHGVLHLLGYDHIVKSDARKMRAREKHIISSVKDNDPK